MLGRSKLAVLLVLLALPVASYGFLVTDPCPLSWMSSFSAKGRTERMACGQNAMSSARFEVRKCCRNLCRNDSPVLMTQDDSHDNVDSNCVSHVVFDPQKFGSTAEERRRASIPTSKACGIKLVLTGKVAIMPSFSM